MSYFRWFWMFCWFWMRLGRCNGICLMVINRWSSWKIRNRVFFVKVEGSHKNDKWVLRVRFRFVLCRAWSVLETRYVKQKRRWLQSFRIILSNLMVEFEHFVFVVELFWWFALFVAWYVECSLIINRSLSLMTRRRLYQIE